MQGARDEAVVIACPLTLLEDLCDCAVLKDCELIFDYVESKLTDWLAPPFKTSILFKNTMLRFCNSIKRRLSKSQDTIFTGRILMFLAAVTPLTDRSGVNLKSSMSTNKTEFDEDAGKDEGGGGGGGGSAASGNVNGSGNAGGSSGGGAGAAAGAAASGAAADGSARKSVTVSSAADASEEPIDYGFYRQFWKLQHYFLQPTLCMKEGEWGGMTQCVKTFLDACDSLKLDNVDDSGGGGEGGSADSGAGEEYFAKYLTSVKLFNLQHADSSFRRQILMQFLIMTESLLQPNKFRKGGEVSGEQKEWMATTRKQVLKLLPGTPPDGDGFKAAIEHALLREKSWIEWKNKGCADFVKPKAGKMVQPALPPQKKKRPLVGGEGGDEKRAKGGGGGAAAAAATPAKRVVMGSAELTRLWNLTANNMDGCKGVPPAVPGMEDFFENARMELNPAEDCDEEYWSTKKPAFGWRALRVLANQQLKHFSEYSPKTVFGGETKDPAELNVTAYLEYLLRKKPEAGEAGEAAAASAAN